jgi:hypothetical protein
MKTNHLIASAVVAAGLIFSANTQAHGLVGGFGGNMGGGLGAGMGNMGAAMNGNASGAFGANSDGFGRVNQSISRDARGAGKDAGRAPNTAKKDTNTATESAATLGGTVSSSTTQKAGNVTGATEGGASATAQRGREADGTTNSALGLTSQGGAAAAAQHGSESGSAANNALTLAGSGGAAANATKMTASNASAQRPTDSSSSPTRDRSTGNSASLIGGANPPKSEFDAGAGDEVTAGRGNSSASQNSAATASISR